MLRTVGLCSLYFNEIQGLSSTIAYCLGIPVILVLRGPSGLFYFITVNLVFSSCLFLYSYFLALKFYCVFLCCFLA